MRGRCSEFCGSVGIPPAVTANGWGHPLLWWGGCVEFLQMILHLRGATCCFVCAIIGADNQCMYPKYCVWSRSIAPPALTAAVSTAQIYRMVRREAARRQRENTVMVECRRKQT